ncbi:MAG: proton-conducting transporter membrane subunit [Prolixibacteraceae bacterium]|jgi:formate hydrogenlyase subunit 3/multisubunit Na+/H+ antiporter MnhD subunit|nr:proton-conducting transporter membrane subunit [Prolixibacteraceae bacterium]
MAKLLFEIFNLIAIATVISIPFLNTKGRGILTLSIIAALTGISSILALSVFVNGPAEFIYGGSWITGKIPIRIDYLSAWFILIINFTFLTGAWYGFRYMKKYIAQADNIALHAIAFLLVYTSLNDICMVQNSIAMLVVWEIMALSSFIVIIFEHYKKETLKAGINFLIQSHVCILFLTIAFMWVKIKTNSFDFAAITDFSTSQPVISGVGLFVFFFFGFAIKAGFVPFHTWLPLAHPAAPAHISGIMSGVIIKIGIYGILRVLTLIETDMVAIGYFVLFISVITGVYGVMLAIVQHNLKKLLAYHSIENIGIIGIGIGLGCLGIGYDNQIMAVAGFGGALLHTLNHSLFKSLLFFGAGNVYLVKHHLSIEALGGLMKRIPHTAYLFLIGSLAICGLPPFNGFISEFFIYSGLFKGLSSDLFLFILTMLFSILALVLIGGLALICFTKAFGIVFLGTPRENSKLSEANEHEDMVVEKARNVLPLYLIAAAIIFIGLFPFLLIQPLTKIIALYVPQMPPDVYSQIQDLLKNLTTIGWFSFGFVALGTLVYFVRSYFVSRHKHSADVTWGCGYTGETQKMQYTASSFIRTYRKLAELLLLIKKQKRDATGLYPEVVKQETHPGDWIESLLIDTPVIWFKKLLRRFRFLQNGNIQTYILYGFIFISLAVMLPVIIDKIAIIIKFLNHL